MTEQIVVIGVKVKCALESKFGTWKIGHYNRKPPKDDSESENDSESESESDSESESESSSDRES